MLEDGPAHFDDIQDGGGEGYNRWYYVVIREGRNREVRRLWEAVGIRVSRLMRVRYGNIIIPKSLRKGRTRDLDASDIKQLGESVGLELEVKSRAPAKKRAWPGGKKVYKGAARKSTVKKKRSPHKRTR